MLGRVLSVGVFGIDGYLVQVEFDVRQGLPAIVVVGLPDAAVKESKDRVATALKNSGYRWPGDGRITINLAPADTKKEGPAFDLALALGALSATGQLLSDRLKDYAAVGELALDGSVRESLREPLVSLRKLEVVDGAAVGYAGVPGHRGGPDVHVPAT